MALINSKWANRYLELSVGQKYSRRGSVSFQPSHDFVPFLHHHLRVFFFPQHGFPPAHLYANQRGASSSHMEPPPQQQQSSSKNPTYGGHVPAATRQPPANFSKPIVRQPNAGWIPAPEYHRRHSGDPPQHHTPVSAGLMSVMKPNGSAFSNSLASHQQGSAAVVASSGGQDRSHSSTLNRAPLESAASNGKMVMVDIFCKNCRKEANFMCSACKSVHYCSIDCQVILFSISAAF